MDSDWPGAPQCSPRTFSAHSAFQAVAFLLFTSLPICAQTSILGFTPPAAAHESEIENKFKAIPSPDEERRQHHIFTAEPHVAGSPRNNELARYIAD